MGFGLEVFNEHGVLIFDSTRHLVNILGYVDIGLYEEITIQHDVLKNVSAFCYSGFHDEYIFISSEHNKQDGTLKIICGVHLNSTKVYPGIQRESKVRVYYGGY